MSFGAANMETLFFAGTSTKLKTGDALLIVCDESKNHQLLRYGEQVNPDDANKRTEVTLQRPFRSAQTKSAEKHARHAGVATGRSTRWGAKG